MKKKVETLLKKAGLYKPVRILVHAYRRLWVNAKKAAIQVLCSHTRIHPEKIIFDNFLGRGYGDNPKYIAEEILRRRNGWDLVWVTNNPREQFPAGIRAVRYGSMRAFYEFFTAGVWIDNVRNTDRPAKRPGQLYLQTWHGSFPVKRIEGDAIEYLDPGYIKLMKKDGVITDAILTGCKAEELVYKRAFGLRENVEFLRMGIPRNDFLLTNKNNKSLIHSVRNELGVGERFAVLYAPTFRDDGSLKGYLPDIDKIREVFRSGMNRECVFIVRLHPNSQELRKMYRYSDLVIDGTGYPDGQKLSLAADCLITDYSSISFDFVLLEKPVFLYTSDLMEYQKIRGLTQDYYAWPFTRAEAETDLMKNIQDFNMETYKSNVSRYLEKCEIYDKGDAAARIVDWLEYQLSGKHSYRYIEG